MKVWTVFISLLVWCIGHCLANYSHGMTGVKEFNEVTNS